MVHGVTKSWTGLSTARVPRRVVMGGFLEEVFELTPVLYVVRICRPVELCLGPLLSLCCQNRI